jgi:hypothetical protein
VDEAWGILRSEVSRLVSVSLVSMLSDSTILPGSETVHLGGRSRCFNKRLCSSTGSEVLVPGGIPVAGRYRWCSTSLPRVVEEPDVNMWLDEEEEEEVDQCLAEERC